MSGELDRWQSAQSAEEDHYEAFDDRETWSSAHAEEYLTEHFDIDESDLQGEVVLEVGCGLGLIHGLQGCKRVGVDPLGQHLGQYLTEGDATMIEGVGESLPFPDDHFDTVFCINALDHCVSPSTVLSEMRRVLAPGGRLFLSLNTFTLPSAVLKRLTYIDKPHPYHYSHDGLINLIREAGFEVVGDIRRTKTVDSRSAKTLLKTVAAIYLFQLGQSAVVARN